MYQTDANETRTTFEIPEANWAKFAANIEKLSRKSVKLIGEKIQPIVLGYDFKQDHRSRSYKVFQVLLTAAVPRVDGWTFVARLDHSQEAGTLIRMVPNCGVELPARFRDCQPDCDHCGLRRRRRDTFVLRNEAGEFKQVGATCLQDFFGHDASDIAAVAEYLTYAWETARGSQHLGESLNDLRYVSLEDFLGYAARSVRRFGYVSAKAVREDDSLTSTRADALNDMFPSVGGMINLSHVDLETAERALEYIRGECEKPDLNDYMHNVSVIVRSQMIESRHCGIAASIIACYARHVERTAQRAAAIQVDMSGILRLFKTAGSRLKNPAVVLLTQNANGGEEEIRLSVAGARSKFPGTVNITDLGHYPDNQWYGRIDLNGSFQARTNAPAGLNATLQAFSADPARVAAEYGRRTGNCCFCRKSLTDSRSTEVGYGGTCAKKYGLSWGTPSRREFVAEAA